MGGVRKLGILSYQAVGDAMAGPAIRAWELARALSADLEVVLFAPEDHSRGDPGFRIEEFGDGPLEERLERCDALLVQGSTLERRPDLGALDCFLVIDLYVPLMLEALVKYAGAAEKEQEQVQGHVLMATWDRLAAGDYFLCASERQKNFWLGWLAAAGRLSPAAFAADPTFDSLVGVVPFGIADEPPEKKKDVVKGVLPGIGADDELLLWGGGIYDWLDPLTPIRAMALLRQRRPRARLLFLGARHPDPKVPAMQAYTEAEELSRELGLLNENVFFNDSWVPYDQRGDYLLEADLGVCAGRAHVENRFAFRTRILDCMWAQLPVVTTAGDSLSALVERRQLGLTVPAGDAEAFAAAVERLLDDDGFRRDCRRRLGEEAGNFRWSRLAAPLRRRLAAVDAPAAPADHHARLDREKLWNIVREKDAAIEELQSLAAEKDGHIANLQAMVREKDGHIENLLQVTRELEERLERSLGRRLSSRLRRLRGRARGDERHQQHGGDDRR